MFHGAHPNLDTFTFMFFWYIQKNHQTFQCHLKIIHSPSILRHFFLQSGNCLHSNAGVLPSAFATKNQSYGTQTGIQYSQILLYIIH